MSEDDGRDVAANVFDVASSTALGLARVSPDPIATGALIAAAGLAGLIGSLVRTMGTGDVVDLVEELQRRKDEGVITDSHVARDNEAITEAVAKLFKDRD